MEEQSLRPWRHYTVHHDTAYCYAYVVSSARHRAHLLPRASDDQNVEACALTVNQPLSEQTEDVDYFGNGYHDFAIHVPHRLLEVCATMRVAVREPIWPDTSLMWSGESLARKVFDPRDASGTELAMRYGPYLADSPMIQTSPEAVAWGRAQIGEVPKPLHVQLLAMTQAFYSDFKFDPEATRVGTPLVDVFRNKRGVCQDFAQALIATLRGLGVPARYVSGYILTEPPPGQPRLIGADATHAWVEAWCPGHGWLGLDPTNGKRVTDEFVTLARGRDYADVIPLRGVVVGGGEHTLEVSVTMVPEGERAAVASEEMDGELG